MPTTVNGTRPETDTSLFVACINLKWPDTGDQDKAMYLILKHPKIKRKINFESKKFSDMNPELDREDLRREIKTLLYLAIKREFSLGLDPAKMEGWLCSRIAWRALDHVSKECDLVYEVNDETGTADYRRVEKLSLDHLVQTTTDLQTATVSNGRHDRGGRKLNGTTVAFGDQISADIERHPNFETFLRRARIKITHKHVLMYVIAMNYNFRELADVYGVSSPTARKLYRRAVLALKRYIMSLPYEEQVGVQNLLVGVYERS